MKSALRGIRPRRQPPSTRKPTRPPDGRLARCCRPC